jgi:PQQ-dependent dehydrogenase (methanol/ethanol family)
MRNPLKTFSALALALVLAHAGPSPAANDQIEERTQSPASGQFEERAQSPASGQFEERAQSPASGQFEERAQSPASGQLAGSAHAPASGEAATPEEGDWPLHGRTHDEQRHSPLAQVNRDNVAKLGLAWSQDMGTRRGLEATPIVVGGRLYVTGTWSVVHAFEAATGEPLWRFDPQVPKWKGRYACCDVVNRGVAYAQGRIFVGTIDGRLIALDARTGEKLWDTVTVDPDQPYTITGAPRVVQDMVVVGNGGADLAVRGHFSAYDQTTGALRWRFYTVPASKDGPHEHPELEMAAKTWSRDSMWASGLGGTVWDAFVYDPELDLLYAGVGNSSVYDRAVRSPGGGDNLFLTSILALRPDTGRLVWHYQTTPAESWDYTATQPMILADLEISGRTRKVLMQAPKNGFFYVLDRATGELLSAEPYVHTSWATHVDMQTGRPVERPEADWSKQMRMVSPGPPGGHNWHPMSFSPETGLVYVPTSSNVYSYYPEKDFELKPATWNTSEDMNQLHVDLENWADTLNTCAPTQLVAWDPVAGAPRWRVEHSEAVPAGVLSTAGGLVFQATGRHFRAYDDRDGTLLWDVETSVGIMAPPISYALDGVQYIAVVGGLGGSHGGHFTRTKTLNEGRVFAFRLGGDAPMPAATPKPAFAVRYRPEQLPDEASVDRGRALYARNCFRCHGVGAVTHGMYTDLRGATPEVHAHWRDIVLGGTRQSNGMPGFADLLSEQDADDIEAYVVARSLHEPGFFESAARAALQRICIPASWVTD